MKHKIKKTDLQKAIEKLIQSYDSTDILCTLIAYIDNNPLKEDIGRLNEEMILHLTTTQRMNVVKAQTLTEQIKIEESMKTIFPYYAEQQTNLHLQY